MCRSFLIFVFFTVSSLYASSRVYINIGSPEFKRPIVALYSKCSEVICPEIKDIESTTASDLVSSNVFVMLPNKMMPDLEQRGDMMVWKISGAEYLLLLDFTNSKVAVKVFNVNTSEEILYEKVDREDSYIDTSHNISDLIFRRLTGEKSIFKSKIALVCKKNGYKNLYMMDYDGKRMKQLTSFKSVIVSPAWSPDGKEIAYARYEMKYYRGQGRMANQNLYIYNLRSQRERMISGTTGQNSGPVWSPDGKQIAFTMSKGESPNLYVYDLDKEETKPLVQNPGIDVEPSYSPDGKWLVFSSSKTGNPELYKMDLQTKQQTRLTYTRYYNSSPVWSPTGDTIAFAGLDNPFGKKAYFDIFLIDPSVTKIERLTIDSGSNEDPSWSSDGRHLVYSSTRNKGSDIYFINSDDTGERRLTKDLMCYSPDWSK